MIETNQQEGDEKYELIEILFEIETELQSISQHEIFSFRW